MGAMTARNRLQRGGATAININRASTVKAKAPATAAATRVTACQSKAATTKAAATRVLQSIWDTSTTEAGAGDRAALRFQPFGETACPGNLYLYRQPESSL